MNTIVVWVIMTISGHNGTITYSPPFATEAECERIVNMIPHSFASLVGSRNQCVKMEIVK
jgi:hypothetical protein